MDVAIAERRGGGLQLRTRGFKSLWPLHSFALQLRGAGDPEMNAAKRQIVLGVARTPKVF